jgi:hypothetical protein
MANDPYAELAEIAPLLTEEERAAAELLLAPSERDFIRSLPDDILNIAHEAAQAAEAVGRGATWEEVIPFLPEENDIRRRFAEGLARGCWQ